MKINDFLNAYEYSCKNYHYPSGFFEEYIPMECLAERNGIDTFLVQNKKIHGSGNLQLILNYKR